MREAPINPLDTSVSIEVVIEKDWDFEIPTVNEIEYSYSALSGLSITEITSVNSLIIGVQNL